MFKENICRFCKWILDKFDKSNANNISKSNFTKTPINKIQIIHNNKDNKNNLIDRTIYFFNIGDKTVHDYMKTCIQSYKDNNKDFDFKFLNLSRDEFYNLDIVKDIIIKTKIDRNNITDDIFYKILYYFKFNWLYLHGGIICDLNTYCCKSLEDLVYYESFVMSKSFNANISKDYCCIGLKKGLNTTVINNIIYPPINYDCECYESMRLAFYNGSLNKNMFNNIIISKLHNYIYKFDR